MGFNILREWVKYFAIFWLRASLLGVYHGTDTVQAMKDTHSKW